MVTRIFGLVLAILLSFVQLSGCLKGEAIKAVYGRQVSFYRGDLIWFVEGINEKDLAYETGITSPSYYISMEPVDPLMALRFDSLSIPIFIQSVSTFISDEDYFPGLPGDQFSPIYLALYSGLSGFPDSILTTPVEVSATGDWAGDGEWVSAETGYLLYDKDCFWAAVLWQDSMPYAPCVRYDMGVPRGKSVFGFMEEDERVWVNFQLGNYRIRAKALENDLDGSWTISPDAAVPDSFRIYSSGQAIVYPDDVFHDTTVIGSSHCRVKLPSPKNYFCVTSFANDTESAPSDIVLIKGSTEQRAEVRFDPEEMDISTPPNSDTGVSLILTNKNGRDINYRISEVNFGSGIDTAKIALYFSTSEDAIRDDHADTITTSISLQDLAYGSYQASVVFNFWDSIQGYMDEEYAITMVVEEFTYADEPINQRPKEFYLGQNYPNPFNNSTIIPYSLPEESSDARAEIFDLLGRRVAVFPLNGVQRGYLVWDGRNESGVELASGIYFLRLRSGRLTRICKMIMLK